MQTCVFEVDMTLKKVILGYVAISEHFLACIVVFSGGVCATRALAVLSLLCSLY